MATKEKWSAEVTEHSDALDLEAHVFEKDDPREIANSLKRSAEKSDRRRSEPYRSAMSMLTFSSTAPARACQPSARGAGAGEGRTTRPLRTRHGQVRSVAINKLVDLVH